jgi:very-short-patch-repair endonuclease
MRQIDGTEALTRVRELRRSATEAEKRLWAALRARRLEGFKFRRQMWIGPCIADFCCMEAKLIVEVDGSQHEQFSERDRVRAEALAREGYRVLRFWNNEVRAELEGVLTAIRTELLARVPSPSRPAMRDGPLPLPERERGL